MKLVVVIAASFALTALGLYVGWAMDNSALPPAGGGWRCYLSCVALVWAAPLGSMALWSLPAVCRRIAESLTA